MATQTMTGRTGGAYIPPAKLRALQASVTDKSSVEYQRIAWEALKKSINGLINKVNTSNIKNIVPELFSENLVRGRGLFCRSLMKAQSASLPFTPVYACLVAVVNTKFPQIGELLLMRLISQFRRAYKRSDKNVCLAVTKFLAHLVNFRVANEIVSLQLLTLLLEKPTDDSVEVAVGFMREVGAFLSEESSRATNAVFERFRAILHEGIIDKRTQYMVEVLFQIRKDKFRDNIAIPDELDLIEEEDQMTHNIGLTDEVETEDALNVFNVDPDFLENEAKYLSIKKEILGDESEQEGDSDDDEEEEDDDDDEEFEQEQKEKAQVIIQDQTNTNIVNLRRAIYLTIMSALTFEECTHKLMKLDIQQGQENELTSMIVECCSQEKTFNSFYGLIGERFCRLNRMWADAFARGFEETYNTIHRFETNRLRNIAKYYAHLLATDAIDWTVFSLVTLTEDTTTSSSRIFLKILLVDLSEALGLKNLNVRFQDPTMVITVQTPSGLVNRSAFDGLFPKDHPKNTRFAINYFTSIGLGALTEQLREFIKNAPKVTAGSVSSSGSDSSSGSESDSDSSSSSYSSVSSRRESRSRRRGRSYSSSPRARRSRSPISSSSSSSKSRSPSQDRGRKRSTSSSVSPKRAIPSTVDQVDFRHPSRRFSPSPPPPTRRSPRRSPPRRSATRTRRDDSFDRSRQKSRSRSIERRRPSPSPMNNRKRFRSRSSSRSVRSRSREYYRQRRSPNRY